MVQRQKMEGLDLKMEGFSKDLVALVAQMYVGNRPMGKALRRCSAEEPLCATVDGVSHK